jgi:S-formylglutathione hydrolase FrmB
MALMKCNFFSQTLGKCVSMYVVLPQKSTAGQIGIENKCEDKKYKSLLLLHGLSDDESIWLRRTSIERYAAEYGIAVIMPCGEKSFYSDMKYGDPFYTYIAKEVPRIAREFFNISEKREDSFIAGISMGGYGALKIGLRENDLYSCAVGLSSVADIVGRSIPKGDNFRDFHKELVPIFGEEMNIPKEDDLFSLSQMKVDSKESLPKILMLCGTADFMYQDNLKLKAHLEKLPIDYTYEETEGKGHNWGYWDDAIRRVLEWLPL